MKKHVLTAALLMAASMVSAGFSADWIVAPSYYTHDPVTGQRVSQYKPIPPVYVYGRSDYLRSGYRHTRSSIQAGGSMDQLHIVEEWGRPIRPYGEWRFPYRPYSVPYSQWGPPYAGLGYGGGYWPGYYPGGPGAAPYAGRPPVRQPPAGAYSTVPPWADGSYPQYQSGLPQRPPHRPRRSQTPSNHP